MNFFSQQFQAPYPRRDQENGATKQSPDGCKGINCYRCSAFIPECEGVCSKCGTLCQRPGGPCKACRDICETCGKPKYRCTSASARLEASDAEKEGDSVDTEDDETRPASREQTRAASELEDANSPVPVSQNEAQREGSLLMTGGEIRADKGVKKSKERRHRPPPERKSKDPNSIKRVRGKRPATKNVDEQNEPIVDAIEEQQIELDEHRESKDSTPVKELPAQPQPSAFPTKATKKTKPSKKILSQTVVYKEKEKAPKSERKSSEHQEDTNDVLVVTSPTPAAETAESGEEQMPAEGEGTGEEIPVTGQKVEGDNDRLYPCEGTSCSTSALCIPN